MTKRKNLKVLIGMTAIIFLMVVSFVVKAQEPDPSAEPSASPDPSSTPCGGGGIVCDLTSLPNNCGATNTCSGAGTTDCLGVCQGTCAPPADGVIACSGSAGCSDGNSCTTDTCYNPGTCSSYFDSTVTPGTHLACTSYSCTATANTSGACVDDAFCAGKTAGEVCGCAIPAATSAQYFDVIQGATVTINKYSVCRKVTNSNVNHYFVPINSPQEWSNFYLNKPADVTISACCP